MSGTSTVKHAQRLEALTSYHNILLIHCLHAAMVGLCCNIHPVLHNHAADKHALPLAISLNVNSGLPYVLELITHPEFWNCSTASRKASQSYLFPL